MATSVEAVHIRGLKKGQILTTIQKEQANYVSACLVPAQQLYMEKKELLRENQSFCIHS